MNNNIIGGPDLPRPLSGEVVDLCAFLRRPPGGDDIVGTGQHFYVARLGDDDDDEYFRCIDADAEDADEPPMFVSQHNDNNFTAKKWTRLEMNTVVDALKDTKRNVQGLDLRRRLQGEAEPTAHSGHGARSSVTGRASRNCGGGAVGIRRRGDDFAVDDDNNSADEEVDGIRALFRCAARKL